MNVSPNSATFIYNKAHFLGNLSFKKVIEDHVNFRYYFAMKSLLRNHYKLLKNAFWSLEWLQSYRRDLKVIERLFVHLV